MRARPRMNTLTAGALALGLAACAPVSNDTEGALPGTVQAPIIYGRDDRIEYYDVTDPELGALADLTVATLPSGSRATGRREDPHRRADTG